MSDQPIRVRDGAIKYFGQLRQEVLSHEKTVRVLRIAHDDL